MIRTNTIENIEQLAQQAPVLVIGKKVDDFKNYTLIEADIPSQDLGAINTASGVKFPKWLESIQSGKSSKKIIINNIDSLDVELQEKFYELLKYKTISSMDLPKDCTIIVLANNIENVSDTLQRLCLIIE